MKSLLYPDNWSAIAHVVKESNDWCCQGCGKACRRPGELNLGWEYTLTVAHWDRDYISSEIFVVALCKPCHFLHDCRHGWEARRRHQMWRRHLAGQLDIGLEGFVPGGIAINIV